MHFECQLLGILFVGNLLESCYKLLDRYHKLLETTKIFWKATFRKAFGACGKHGASLALVIGMGDETMTGLLLRGSMAIANVSKEEDGISEQPSYAIHFKHKYCDIFHDMVG